jgi:4-amino-4-deoxy-L-arabinose transferase-like glycosyltransferase
MSPSPSARSSANPTVSRTLVLLIAVLVLGASLRAVRLADFGLGVDEDVTVQTSLALLDAGYDLRHVVSEDIQGHFRLMPVTYYLTAASLRLFGFSEIGFRLPFHLLGVLSILLLYGFARRVTDEPTALLAAFFLAVAATAIQCSQTARYVGPSVAAAIALAWGTVAFLERPGPRRAALVVALLALAAATNIFLLGTAPLLWLLLAVGWLAPGTLGWEKRPRWVGRTLLGTALLALLVLFLALPFVRDWLAQSTRYFAQHAGLRLNQTARTTLGILLRLEIPVVVFGLAGAVVLVRARRAAGMTIVLFALGPEAMLLTLAPFVYAPARYVVFTLPFWLLLAAVFAVRAVRRSSAPRLAAAGTAGVILAFLFYHTAIYLQDGDGRSAMKEAFLRVARSAGTSDVVASTFHTDLPARLYRLPIPEGNHVQLHRQWGDWLGRFPDRRVWIIGHSSFDPGYQKLTLTRGERCAQDARLPASTRFTVQWVTIYRCDPIARTP